MKKQWAAQAASGICMLMQALAGTQTASFPPAAELRAPFGGGLKADGARAFRR